MQESSAGVWLETLCWAPGFWTVLPLIGRGLAIPRMEGNLLRQELCGPSEDSQ